MSKARPAKRRRTASDDMVESRAVYPAWTVEVENFGRISRGAVTMAPLVLLVGRNNTGKSYMASLLWSLLNFDSNVISSRPREVIKIPHWIKQNLNETGERGESTSHKFEWKDFEELAEYISRYMLHEKAQYFTELFSVSQFGNPKVRLRFDRERCEDYFFSTEPMKSGNIPVRLRWDHDHNRSNFVAMLQVKAEDRSRSWLPEVLYQMCATDLLRGAKRRVEGETLYIPAARTGLMLALNPLLTTLLNKLGLQDSESSAKFTQPTIKFLQTVTNQGNRRAKNEATLAELASIAADIEENVLGGSVQATDDEAPVITYRQKGSNQEFPLHATSSMVTELSPFLIVLKNGGGAAGIVFEEPEAHLHLSAQRQIARAIARLVNAGIPIVVTTHSDTFLQQVNNLCKIYEKEDREEVLSRSGYTKRDLINPKNVRAYEFREKKGGQGTEIVELEAQQGGFEVPSLNETLAALAEETIELS